MLDHLPLPEIIATCREQTERFRKDMPSDSRVCLELWRRAIDLHDPDAWQGLIEQYTPLIRERLRRAGLDDDTLAETIHQTFIQIWDKSQQGAFSTHGRTLPEVLQYLLNSARYAVLAVLRQRQDQSLPDDQQPGAVAMTDHGPIVDAQLDTQDIIARIRATLQPDEWQILVLRYLADLPPRAIAQRLAIPVPQVYTILAKVRRYLRTRPDFRAELGLEDDAIPRERER